MSKENRLLRFANVELRADGEEEKMQIEGLACVFDKETDMGWFYEKIDRHAFDDCDMSDVVLNKNHDDSILLARTTNKSLVLSIDDKGLHQKATIIDTTQGKDTYKEVKEGLITKMSFSFEIDRDEGAVWTTDADGKEHRTIKKIKRLFDTSVVTFPAYPQTKVFARNEDYVDELAEEHRKAIQMENEKREQVVEDVNEEVEENQEEVVEETSANNETNETTEEVVEENHEEGEKREMGKMNLDETVKTEVVEERNKREAVRECDSKENIKAWRKAIMDGKEQRAGLKSTDGGVPVPTLFQSYVERAWEKLDIIPEVSESIIKALLKVPYEASADGANYHAEGADAPNEEALTLGSTSLIPMMIKKWISVTDELEALTDEEFMKYVADEVVYQTAKFLQDKVIAGVGQGAGSNEGVVGITNASLTESITAALTFNAANEALAVVDGGDAPLMVMNRKTFFHNILGLTDLEGNPIYKIINDNAGKPQYFVNGVRVKFSKALKAYDNADAGDVWAVVGDFNAYKLNLPNGREVKTLYDPYTLATEDKSRMIGKIFAAGNVTKPEALAKLVVPSTN